MKFLHDASAIALVSLGLLFAGCRTEPGHNVAIVTKEFVGQIGTNRFYTPANQVLTPAGIQVELPGMRPQALALSPDGQTLITSGKTRELVVVEPATGLVR